MDGKPSESVMNRALDCERARVRCYLDGSKRVVEHGSECWDDAFRIYFVLLHRAADKRKSGFGEILLTRDGREECVVYTEFNFADWE